MLMGELAFDLDAVPERHVDGDAERRRSVQIHTLPGHDLEEVSTETITGEGRHLDGQRREDAGRDHLSGLYVMAGKALPPSGTSYGSTDQTSWSRRLTILNSAPAFLHRGAPCAQAHA